MSNVVLKTPQRKLEDVDAPSTGTATPSKASPWKGRNPGPAPVAAPGSDAGDGSGTTPPRPKWSSDD